MELNEKLQELRKQKGLTQEELSKCLYVSRTAVSKWESGRGYPSIDSLKAIASFFSITVDELLSSEELLTIAEEKEKEKGKHLRDLVFGCMDLFMLLLLFLPLFAHRGEGSVLNQSLFILDAHHYLKVSYLIVVVGMIMTGILTLALQNCQARFWIKSKERISLSLSVISVLLFVISLQPYASIFSFVLLAIKVLLWIKSV